MLILKFVSLTAFVISVQYTTDKESSRMKIEQERRLRAETRKVMQILNCSFINSYAITQF
ncbi:hypothetical protein T12_9080 [Trichinella patagoniensis]|uniref:Uncharacterized protein n=1 Tax=Trichinella patagoniensis TaxID=990121 RepID=A0A0V1A417_9BILA|nr:hypothetical protein T12_9080 [Trichinella patagoniensis]